MSTLNDIRAHYAEYNTGSHPVDWYIDRGLALAADVGALLAAIDQQQAVIDAAKRIAIFSDAPWLVAISEFAASDPDMPVYVFRRPDQILLGDFVLRAGDIKRLQDALEALKDAQP